MRSIRVLVGVLGMDQHELGAVGIAKMLRDAGMEVIYLGCFNTPQTIVKAALEEDVDVIGISSHSWEYIYYTPELLELLKTNDLALPVIIGGSVITEEDGKAMLDLGVAAVFGSGAAVEDMVSTVRRLAADKVTA